LAAVRRQFPVSDDGSNVDPVTARRGHGNSVRPVLSGSASRQNRSPFSIRISLGASRISRACPAVTLSLCAPATVRSDALILEKTT
jgi:hypothetical protein